MVLHPSVQLLKFYRIDVSFSYKHELDFTRIEYPEAGQGFAGTCDGYFNSSANSNEYISGDFVKAAISRIAEVIKNEKPEFTRCK